MKKSILFSALMAGALVSKGQQWYQNERKFSPFVAGAAAAGNMQMFKDLKSLVGSHIWSALEGGLVNKNTSFGISATSYEWTKSEETYFGPVIQRRLFVVSRLEGWLSGAYGIPLKGKLEEKFQGAFRLRFHFHKDFALETSFQKTLSAESGWSLNRHQAVAISAICIMHGNVNSNGK